MWAPSLCLDILPLGAHKGRPYKEIPVPAFPTVSVRWLVERVVMPQ